VQYELTPSITRAKLSSNIPITESLPDSLVLAKLNSKIPRVTKKALKYLEEERAVFIPRKFPTITGRILQDLAKACVGYETYYNA
jgi:hypothetical protein